MKILLLKDMKGLGKRGEIKVVKDGYAENLLIPRGIAVKVTERSLDVLNKQNEDALNARLKAEEEAKLIQKQLEKVTVEFEANVGRDGQMFGTISYKQIEEKLKAEHNIQIDKRKIIDRIPVDHIGYTRLPIELFKGVVGTINVHVKEKK